LLPDLSIEHFLYQSKRRLLLALVYVAFPV
jgi:hypothetical protein